ncbi:hypothetical protein CHS0354_017251 [Potamilus streckersoni]|uniref:Uncharacterized protein n=1 Tax=Potamilus streckersoni TaxID=2493646 RepID=A0AAE0RZ11_9BIVA|nr:hypothetical protein CHS0354_017251 [Potamilus streckersoni]
MCRTLVYVTVILVYVHAVESTDSDPEKPSSNYGVKFKKLTSPYYRDLGTSVPVNRMTDVDKTETGDDSYVIKGTTVMLTTTPNSKSVKHAYTERNVHYSISTSEQNKGENNSVGGKGSNTTRLTLVRNEVPETSVLSAETGSTTESIIAVRGSKHILQL